MAVRIVDRRPSLTGPMQAVRIACGGVVAVQPRADLAVALAESLSPLSARVRFAGASIRRDAMSAQAWRGQLDYDGRDARNRHGALRFAADRARLPQGRGANAVAGWPLSDRRRGAGRRGPRAAAPA